MLSQCHVWTQSAMALLSFTYHITLVYKFSSIPFSFFLISAVYRLPMKKNWHCLSCNFGVVVTYIVVTPEWSDGFVEGFFPFASNDKHFLTLFMCFTKNGLMCGCICCPKWDCFFTVFGSTVDMFFYGLNLLHWNRWRSSHFFIESSIVVSLANMSSHTVYYNPVPNLCIGLVALLKSPEAKGLNTTWESLCLAVISCFFLLHFHRYCFIWEYGFQH